MAVEAHQKVVAAVVERLMLFRACREQEGSPVGVSPDDAAGVQDDLAAGLCDFADFVEVAGTDLMGLVGRKIR